MGKYYYHVGGSLNPNDPTYVTRNADQEIFELLTKGQYCFVFNSRQMGKSSLCTKTIQKLDNEGIKRAFIDVTLIGNCDTSRQWYQSFINLLLMEFDLNIELDLNSWYEQHNYLTEIQLLDQFLQSVILEQITENIVIFIDEIDRFFTLTFKEDFFAYIRGCYNRRSKANSPYNRLTFCLLGVATPADLITDKTKTPFNIGNSIELTGLTFAEAKNALIDGFDDTFADPEAVLQQILDWTGGQPFLTQKLCQILMDKIEENNNDNIDEIVNQYMVEGWESQDQEQHLRTIRDRLIKDENKAVQLLGLYQEIVTEKRIKFDGSDSQTELRLSGLVVRKDDYLEVYNPIYAAIFNQDWLHYQLSRLRPYSVAINSWEKHKEAIYLLKGESLKEARIWAKDKKLSTLDYEFLAASQTEQIKKENFNLNQIINRSKVLFIGTIIGAFLIVLSTTFYTKQEIEKIQTTSKQEIERIKKISQIESKSTDILAEFKSQELNNLLSALKVGYELKKLVKPEQELTDYPVFKPVSALLNIMNQISEKNQLIGHKDSVKIVSFSPDGQIIASGGNDGLIKLWRPNGTKIETLQPLEHKRQFKTEDNQKPERDRIAGLSFSPDGQIIASISEDGLVNLWQKNGTLINSFTTLSQTELQKFNRVYTISFSPDGQLLALGGTSGKFQLWNKEGKLLKTLGESPQSKSPSIISLSFSPNGKMIVIGKEDGTIQIWSTEGTLIKTFKGHKLRINSVIFSPNGNFIASASNDTLIKIWGLDGTLLNTLEDHKYSVFSLSFSPNGQFLASGSEDKTIKIWQFNENKKSMIKPIKTLLGHDKVFSVNFSSDGKTLASGSLDTTIKLWQIPSLTSSNNNITSMSFSQDGKNLILGDINGQIKFQSLDGKVLAIFNQNQHNAEIINITINQDKTFIFSSGDGIISLWNNEGNFIKNLMQYKGNINSIALDYQGKKIAILDDNKTVKLLSLDGKNQQNIINEEGKITKIAFSPDGKILASGDQDGIISLWGTDGTLINRSDIQNSSVSSVIFNSNGSVLATAYNDGKVKLWQIEKGNKLSLILSLDGNNGIIYNLSFSPDNKILVGTTKDDKVIFWKLTLADLLTEGCNWIKDYLDSHPRQKKTLEICEN